MEESKVVPLKVADDDYSNLSACDKCVAEGGSCCTGCGSGIFVTIHDMLRIKRYNNMPLSEIAIFKKIDDPKWLADLKENDPFFFEAVRDGKVLQLIRKDGHCQFLVDKKGCTVFNHRPAICRMFPFTFDFTQDGKLMLVVPKASRQKDEDCTILKDNFYRSKGANLRAMNSTKEIMMGLMKDHIYELQMYKLYVDDMAKGMPFEDIVSKWEIKLNEKISEDSLNLGEKKMNTPIEGKKEETASVQGHQ